MKLSVIYVGIKRVSTLVDAAWNSGTCQATNLPTSDVAHVIDGGSLLHWFPITMDKRPYVLWDMFKICRAHKKEVYFNPTFVLDGYIINLIKYITHMRRSKGIVSNTVTFTKYMPLRVQKETFLVNKRNKHRFVTLLKDTFNANEIEVIQGEDDADL